MTMLFNFIQGVITMYKGNRMISFVGTIEFDNKTVNIGDLQLEMDNSSEIYYTIKHCMNEHF